MAAHFNTFCAWYVISSDAFRDLPTTNTWTTATYFRFAAVEHFCNKISRILYLDSDMLCLQSLRPLYTIDMKGMPIAAVKDRGLPPNRLRHIGHKGDDYFNAGMLLVDTRKWKEMQTFNRAITMLLDDPNRYKALDQDVLNLIFENKVLWLNEKYNYSNNIQDKYPTDTVLIHYTATPKPWLAWYYCSGANLWAQVAARSEWRNVPIVYTPRTSREMRLLSRSYFQRGEITKSLIWYMKYLQYKIFGTSATKNEKLLSHPRFHDILEYKSKSDISRH